MVLPRGIFILPHGKTVKTIRKMILSQGIFILPRGKMAKTIRKMILPCGIFILPRGKIVFPCGISILPYGKIILWKGKWMFPMETKEAGLQKCNPASLVSFNQPGLFKNNLLIDLLSVHIHFDHVNAFGVAGKIELVMTVYFGFFYFITEDVVHVHCRFIGCV